MKIALAQINPTVGDLSGNVKRILRAVRRAERSGADLCVLPEMCITGYPARDLLLSREFIDDNLKALERLAGDVGEMPVIAGFVDRNRAPVGKGLFNAGALIRGGAVRQVFHKMLLPTYDVFDERRYFDPADGVTVATVAGKRVGLTICEDIWNVPEFWQRRFYAADPVEMLVKKGAEVLITISASPFVIGGCALRRSIAKSIASRHGIPVYYVNQVGGNDQLVFDGCSLAFDARGELIAQGKSFEEDLVFAGAEAPHPALSPGEEAPDETVCDALVLGVRDYARKCGFRDAIVGLSGGIDSAVTACIAVRALGRKHVRGVSMPSMYSSRGSVEDARALAKNLGIGVSVVPITPVYRAYLRTLAPHLRRRRPDTTEENIQARIRGNILMALSNKFGALVLSTGNKSEMAVGYCTLYGDMAGGLAVLSDVPKTLIYGIARHLNEGGEIIPQASISKPPSAELKPGQIDQDTLPPYEVLDAVLSRYIEKRQSPEEIIAAGYGRKLVCGVIRRVERNEYKRHQAPPGLKVTSKAFGYGRRIPLAQNYY
ncbi:MAG: NAD+ synthase [Chlamydiota bacterium]